jgi:putative copper resistance protein D
MALLLDIYGFLSVLVHGAVLVALGVTLGGIAFLLGLARPLAPELGAAGALILRRCHRWLSGSALVLAGLTALGMLGEAGILLDSGLSPGEVLGAGSLLAGLALLLTALAVATLPYRAWDHPEGRLAAILLGLVMLAADVATSHAAARLEGRLPLALLTALHQLGAAIWIGGMPYFLIALAGCRDGVTWRRVGKRFSQMSMAAVAMIAAAGVALAFVYVGSLEGLYGTAYGVMVIAKAALFVGLLLLGLGNFQLVERLRRDPATPILRLRRFAEVELGVGFTVFFAAAALTSAPPAVDLPNDRATLAEIVERMTPEWPRLSSPHEKDLALLQLQARLDAEAGSRARAQRAFVPGAGIVPPRNAADIAWSEYNHHWAGLLVLLMGLLALAERTGRARWARHWPLLFLVMAGFILIRSDPETWPLGPVGFFESLRDPEVVQHRIFVVLMVAYALFEWRVRARPETAGRAALVFPLLTAVGGGLLLTHSHVLANLKDQLLIEMSHVPLALLGLACGWARWLELRLAPPASRVAGWVWPACLVGVGLILLLYREA